MAAILNSAILNSANLWFSHLSISSQSHSQLPRLVPTFCTKNFTHSFWLNLMMAAILNSVMLDWDTVILDLDTLLSSLRFTQKHSHSILTLTQTNSIWLKTHSFYLNLMMTAIFNLSILDSDTLLSSLRFTQKHSHSTLTLTQTNSIWLTWRWQPSGILPSCIWPICTKKLDSFIFT